MELPDLAAFLILQMDVLAELAGKLGRFHDREVWTRKSDKMLSDMVSHCFRDGYPKALASRTHEVVESDSLILYLPIILADKLPEDIRGNMLKELKNGRFNTEYGFATEAPASEFYRADGYWRGPIWAPSTMLIVDGLFRCGETELARETADQFCHMVKKSGCAENFDALTGEGLRDRAYTWTSSVFLLLANEYLLERN